MGLLGPGSSSVGLSSPKRCANSCQVEPEVNIPQLGFHQDHSLKLGELGLHRGWCSGVGAQGQDPFLRGTSTFFQKESDTFQQQASGLRTTCCRLFS